MSPWWLPVPVTAGAGGGSAALMPDPIVAKLPPAPVRLGPAKLATLPVLPTWFNRAMSPALEASLHASDDRAVAASAGGGSGSAAMAGGMDSWVVAAGALDDGSVAAVAVALACVPCSNACMSTSL